MTAPLASRAAGSSQRRAGATRIGCSVRGQRAFEVIAREVQLIVLPGHRTGNVVAEVVRQPVAGGVGRRRIGRLAHRDDALVFARVEIATLCRDRRSGSTASGRGFRRRCAVRAARSPVPSSPAIRSRRSAHPASAAGARLRHGTRLRAGATTCGRDRPAPRSESPDRKPTPTRPRARRTTRATNGSGASWCRTSLTVDPTDGARRARFQQWRRV